MCVCESPQLAHKEGLDNKNQTKHIKSLIVSRLVDGIYVLLYLKKKMATICSSIHYTEYPHINFGLKRNHCVWFATCK